MRKMMERFMRRVGGAFQDPSCAASMALTLSRSSALTADPSVPPPASAAAPSSRALGRGGEDEVPAVDSFEAAEAAEAEALLERSGLRLRLLLRLLLVERRRR